ncbi:hypothetical protein FD33_GL002029 [Companilactobacillus paralimentarius DSM 13238 = JCM 10415]|jgi:Predicted membrane protein (DUF2154).|uniref:LiaF transmembrane domain-containing protein n=1 Tax=Companilactobacillus paralimentarius DSM 13238 = JCM 10415 TaxID=1122151 RepID=A0A0R1PGQ9_9LACO|nr:hypothetical protein [Companilactobacillus paralimentarius]KAE9565578.1 hypothetical protein ATN96_02700 [Companilactobacillus paralimentarius]KRL31404.1 hypothetical protein FD33_GL002029 [Companilactobacillus paralimentarius DSM 13238 = JCM 10415]MDR4932561.1 hypothetical protein [Companilactobacillus paralimentarius]QFR69152.1 hypothetical protein LP238_04550 [Companilactobacillus paralimentarius]
MKNRNGIFWGLFLLLSAAILVVSQLHLITYTFSFWTIIATIFLAAVLIKSLVYFSISGTVFSLAFLGILYAKPLGITAIVPWTILGAALLITIGLSMILNPLLNRHRPWMRYRKAFTRGHRGPFFSYEYKSGPDMKTIDKPDVDVYVKMGNSVRYVKSDDFKTANIDVNMGEAKVYFDHVTVKDTAIINVNVSLGGAELYIPSNWNIIKGVNNNMGNITEDGVRNVDEDSPDVTISGLVSLGNLKISYI